MSGIVIVVGIVFALLVAAVTAHLVLTWMDRKGWVWYRNTNRTPPTPLGLIEEIYQPSIEHVVDQQVTERTEADQPESGEDV